MDLLYLAFGFVVAAFLLWATYRIGWEHGCAKGYFERDRRDRMR